jgi:hypothetical protein
LRRSTTSTRNDAHFLLSFRFDVIRTICFADTTPQSPNHAIDIRSASIDDRSARRSLAGFTSYGPTADQRIKPDILAVGRSSRTACFSCDISVRSCLDSFYSGRVLSQVTQANANGCQTTTTRNHLRSRIISIFSVCQFGASVFALPGAEPCGNNAYTFGDG